MKTSHRFNSFIIINCMAAALFIVLLNFPVSNTEAKFLNTPESFSELAEKASPVVVNIRTEKTVKGGGRVFRHFGGSPFGKEDPFDFFEKFFGGDQNKDFKQRSLGSGFIIDKEGHIVTNNHVIEGADEIKVRLNNDDEYDAEIVGRDPNTDIALIKVKSNTDLPVSKMGDSDALKVGQWVLAIGSPFGLEHTVTAGIVSAKGRVIGSGPYDDFIQTDASINPGNSGGPLINMDGEVVGINTAIIASGQGIGFAVPINLARGIIEQLKKSGEVTRGWLGVAIQDISSEIAEYYGVEDKKGVLVTEIFNGDPADNAGIQAKDIIVSVNGQNVETTRDLTRLIAAISVGNTADILVLRNGKEKKFKVKIAKREDSQLVSGVYQNNNTDDLGIQVSELSPEISRQFNIKQTEGIIVTDVDNDSKGAQAGIMAGDIIKEINHEPVRSIDDYTNAVNKIKSGEPVHMFIQRMNRGFLVIKLIK
ncbi:Serine protease, do-like [Desulfonema limicola]|uniref:Probable periplasmic serine endoprotease DegP-like n=1 Tax=Desulfonema limicola TaxID=45656 RepID=A0A975GFS4_9BACT|nr:DegQ family serine endoprotease [Desulfonema limicola]QTA79616.1 Serine protease, do-like [Desulfonema limicola]